MPEFIIPADYCVALVDLESYPSFLGENWNLEQIGNHFVNQMNKGTMIVWGTGAPASWIGQL